MFVLNFLASLSERGKLFIIVLACFITATLLSLGIGGWWATAAIVIPGIVGVLQVTKGIWTPEEGVKSKIGMASLGVAAIAVLSGEQWRPYLNHLLEPLYDQFPLLKDKFPSDAPSITALLFLAAVILIVNYFSRDKTAMKEHPTPVEKEFPEKDYKTLLQRFANILRAELHNIDLETNWSPEIFTPLDAEVEVKTQSKRLRKVTDLLSAIRSDRRSRVFLVLGDPGSGKSVALRKLCAELLDEVGTTGKLPLYVNLREWGTEERWTECDPPTVENLYAFVLRNLKNRGDVFANEFLDKYFKPMFENGRLFFILDSFDEIPQVLDVDERSWLIHRLSEVIYLFLAGAHESRGLLASRVFRHPTKEFDAKTILEIRPFTESKIVESLRKSPYFDEALVSQLFHRRPELVPIARNPFTAALISSYAKDHGGALPANQSELYSSYIQRRLDACNERIHLKNLTTEKVIAGAIEMADVMLSTQTLGLEASIGELESRMQDYPVEEIIDVLKYARLGRLGSGDQQRFSFVHRRFNEYFVVQGLIEQPEKIPRDAIPRDSRWRDALVLYCEVADEGEARRIAEFCWSEVVQLNEENLDLGDPQYVRSIHSLRFLIDAFRARLNCINSFRREVASLVVDQIDHKRSLLLVKLAVEAVGLLEPKDIDLALVKALKINNHWINDTALRSCRYLPALSEELTTRLRFAIDSIPIITFLKQWRELIFALNLSNVFSNLKRFCYWRTFDAWCLMFGLLLLLGYNPGLWVVVGTVFAAGNWLITRILPDRFSAQIWTHLYQRANPCLFLIWGCFALVFVPAIGGRTLEQEVEPIVAVSILILPFYQLYYFVIPAMVQAMRRARMLTFIAIVAASLGSLSLSMGVLFLFYRLLPETLLVAFAIVFAILVPGAGVLFVAAARWHDFRYLKIVQKTVLSTRKQISEHFSRFRTEHGRHLFVRTLEYSDVQPAGAWPDGRIPNVRNDKASTLLAQLEEKWLGLGK